MLIVRPNGTIIATQFAAHLLALAVALHIAGPLLFQIVMALRRPPRRRRLR